MANLHILAPSNWLQTRQNWRLEGLDALATHSEISIENETMPTPLSVYDSHLFFFLFLWKKKRKEPLIYPSETSCRINYFSTSRRRRRYVQEKQWWQRIKDARRKLCQLITLQKPERKQRMKAISGSRVDYRLAWMPLNACYGLKERHWRANESWIQNRQYVTTRQTIAIRG